MCFLALLHRFVPGYPVVVAANRDEYRDRPGTPPRQLADGVWGGQDPRAGGTWLGVSRRGIVVGVTNIAPRSADPNPEARSRGLLCLDALVQLPTAGELGPHLAGQLQAETYNPFNLLAADAESAVVGTWRAGELVVRALAPGIHAIGNEAPDDPDDPKVTRGLSLLRPYQTIDEAIFEFSRVLADPGARPDGRDAVCVRAEAYGTLSSSVIAVSDCQDKPWRYLARQGDPASGPLEDVWAAPGQGGGPARGG